MNKKELKLEEVKQKILDSSKIKEEDKPSSVKIVEEWYREDLAKNELVDRLKLLEIEVEEFLEEIGLL